MRSINLRIVFTCTILIVALLFGCDKKSGVEGKLLDGKGKPLAGVKVVAKATNESGEQFESITGTDGGFKFLELNSRTTYELVTYPDGITSNLSIKIDSGQGEQITILQEPIIVRFQPSRDGISMLDTKTGLIWTKDANISGPMPWFLAMDWVKELNIGGHHDWRLPKSAELEDIVKIANTGKIYGTPYKYFKSVGFDNVQTNYWSSSWDGNTQAFYASMDYGSLAMYSNGYYFIGKGIPICAWPVRSSR